LKGIIAVYIYTNQTRMDIINDYSSDEEDIVLEPNIIVYHKSDPKHEVDMFTIIIVIVLFSLLRHMGIMIY
tara:strand:+ start:1098 stop:1310 length:213 start_codon:yes stop_codon:yes gene_type:complete